MTWGGHKRELKFCKLVTDRAPLAGVCKSVRSILVEILAATVIYQASLDLACIRPDVLKLEQATRLDEADFICFLHHLHLEVRNVDSVTLGALQDYAVFFEKGGPLYRRNKFTPEQDRKLTKELSADHASRFASTKSKRSVVEWCESLGKDSLETTYVFERPDWKHDFGGVPERLLFATRLIGQFSESHDADFEVKN